jgi:hypothetical protein
MSVLSKLSSTIPPRARIMLLLTTGMVLVFSVFIFKSVFSSDEDVKKSDIGLTKLTLSNETIKKGGNKKSDLVNVDNNIQDTINQLKKAESDKLNDPENQTSHIPKPNLTDGDEVGDITVQSKENVIDISKIIGRSSDNDVNTSSIIKRKSDLISSSKKKNITSKSYKVVNRDNYQREMRDNLNLVTVIDTEIKNSDSSFSISNYARTTDQGDTNNSVREPTNQTQRNNRPQSTNEKAIERYSKIREQVQGMTGTSDATDDNTSETDNKITSVASNDSNYPSNERRGAGELAYAIIDFEINSDENSIVRATMASGGDSQGAILLGNFQKLDNTLAVIFNTYSIGGVSYPINAIAIDSESWRASLVDDVDNHYFERYTGIILASLLSGYSETLMDQEKYETEGGERGVASKSIDKFGDRLSYSIGRVGSTLAPVFMEGLSRPSTVRVFKDKPVGIMFLADFNVPSRF